MPLLSTRFNEPVARWEGGKIQGSQKTCLKLGHFLLEGREKCWRRKTGKILRAWP